MLTRTKPRLPDLESIALAPIGDDPTYKAGLAKLQALEQRLAATALRRRRAEARLRGAKPGRSAIERAKDLISGAEVQAIDPKDDLRACDEEEFQILRPAIAEATRQLDDIHGNASFALCQKLQPHYGEVMIAALQAIENLAEALDMAAGIRARLRAAGYAPLSTVLPDVVPRAALQLGSPENVGASQAWYFKKALAEAGIIS